jgi:hypothetical protein
VTQHQQFGGEVSHSLVAPSLTRGEAMAVHVADRFPVAKGQPRTQAGRCGW